MKIKTMIVVLVMATIGTLSLLGGDASRSIATAPAATCEQAGQGCSMPPGFKGWPPFH